MKIRSKAQLRRLVVAAYTGRPSKKISTIRHEHQARVAKIGGSAVRLGCNTCPWMGKWEGTRDAGDVMEELRKVFDAQWTVDDDGYTPDEKGEWTPEHLDRLGEALERFDEDVPVTTDELSPASRIHLALSKMTKPEIMEAYSEYGMFKSWSKQRMIEMVIQGELMDSEK